MSKVYVISKSAHDFSPANKYGELKFLSEGPMNRYSVNNIHRQFKSILKNSSPDDYILICGLTIMSSIACMIFAEMHGKVNILLFKQGDYIERNLIIRD